MMWLFFQVVTAIQYMVDKAKVYDAYFLLDNPRQQMSAYVVIICTRPSPQRHALMTSMFSRTMSCVASCLL